MTSTTLHAPGPWTAKDQGEGPRGKSLGICIHDSNKLPLFFLPRGTEKHRANAHLVAAAPELLEQLKLARKCIAWCRAHHEDAQSESGGMPVETLIDATIAKAEGRR